jgi:hypothetical protein
MTLGATIASFSIGASCHAQTQSVAAAVKPALPSIAKAKAPIAVDGKLDEAEWQGAEVISANFLYGKQNVASTEPRMNVRYLWDDAYLYIGYEIFDANLVARGSGESQGPASNQRPGCEIEDSDNLKMVDVVEFFPIFEDKNLFWELHHNAANQFNDLLCVVGLPAWQKTKSTLAPWGVCWARKEFLQDEGDRTFASAVALKPRKDGKPSTVNDSTDEDTGYTAELRLPWSAIGAPMAARGKDAAGKPGPWKMAGREISILAVFQNGDLTDRYHTSATALKPEFFHAQTDKFPRYMISGE